MFPAFAPWLLLILSWLNAFLLAYFLTPPVKRLAERLGAIDYPGEARRVHDRPRPRLGGLTIFLGFTLTVLLFAQRDPRITGILLGAVIVAAMGALDDLVSLNPWLKLIEQIVAALIAVRCGVVFRVLSDPAALSAGGIIPIGTLSVPLTVLWIVACTNAVNLMDGLDGLAVGISLVSALTMLVASTLVSEPAVSLLLAALTGACLGFLPYNMNPAQIFMGDVGSQLLGYLLGTVSILGLFKLHAAATFFVPLLAMALPLTDTAFAFFRRILHGQSPFHADRGHLHHRLLALGLNQRQAVALMVGASAALGILAIVLAGNSPALRLGCLLFAPVVLAAAWFYGFARRPDRMEDNMKNER